MSHGDVNEMPGARELLGRALVGVTVPPGPAPDAVFARAARVRWRRRGVVTGVAAAVVAVSVTAGLGVLPGNGAQATGTADTRPTSRTDGLAKLLPPGTGKLREESFARLNNPGMTDKEASEKEGYDSSDGPYDGFYSVRRDGGVGYLTVQVFPDLRKNWGEPAKEGCPWAVPGAAATCVPETLPHGDLRESSELATEHRMAGNTWGAERSVRLFTKGYMVNVVASSGFDGERALGPRLDAPPLTAEQLRALVMQPQLLP
ncbi:hypothetical protein [Streptomyces sp. NPDC098781]|uniref:hypothetical protein n=1 Tax=Streptomyces sp. NPDC098781 TaxID=3366097 RepID=UPI0037FA11B8